MLQHQNGTGIPPPPPPDSAASRSHKPAKKNLIFMVSDGMGPASLSLTRSFRQVLEGRDRSDTLVLDQHFWGSSRTISSNSFVTDSAAGATAFSCGLKSYNTAISMTPDFEPCGTVLEAAKRAGYTTGLVVTTDITDATPACFASHVYYRSQEDEIALQEIGEGVLGRTVDLILGGGRCHFLPNTTAGSCRLDDVDVTEIAQKKHGYTYADDRAGFDALKLGKNVSLPLLGLFAAGDVPFEIDRRNMADVYPSLSEMALTALTALEEATKDSDKGFFLMIEGSRIDHAGHINDPAAQVREVLEYDKAFKSVIDFIEDSDTEGVLVATSDHETGGLALALRTSPPPPPPKPRANPPPQKPKANSPSTTGTPPSSSAPTPRPSTSHTSSSPTSPPTPRSPGTSSTRGSTTSSSSSASASTTRSRSRSTPSPRAPRSPCRRLRAWSACARGWGGAPTATAPSTSMSTARAGRARSGSVGMWRIQTWASF